MKVKNILNQKGSRVYSTRSDTTVFDAIQKMSDLNIGALLVIDDGKLVGVISERDYRDKIILKGRHSKTTFVKEIMTDHVFCVSPKDDIKLCMKIMTVKKIRHIPVLNGEKLAGIISIGDVVKYIIDQQKVEIRFLKSYIAGSYPA